MKEKKHCPHCGAKTVEYRHTLNKQMLGVMLLLKRNGGVMTMDQLVRSNISFNQKNNFQKLQYWGLIEKVKTAEKQKGVWGLTLSGYDFLLNKLGVYKSVWTYRNQFVRGDEPIVFAKDIDPEPYRQIEDYVADERPRYVDKSGQISFWGSDGLS